MPDQFQQKPQSEITEVDNEQSIISFYRSDKEDNKTIIVCNFVPVERGEYRIGVPKEGTYKIVLNTDDTQFGGQGTLDVKSFKAEKVPMHGYEYSINLHIPPLSVLYLERRTVKRKSASSKTKKSTKK